jgi:hypothetical protein
MSGIGRNDACPCGSGKKFKKCCIDRAANVPFTAADRESALDALADFSARPEFDEDRLEAGIAFWADWMDAHEDDTARRGMECPESVEAFDAWFTLDFPLASGVTLVDEMLRRQRARLRPGEREYLERMRGTHLAPYQVTEVKRDQGLQLIDLWTGQRIWVAERLGTSQLVRWDFLGLRLMRGAQGHQVVDGWPYLYPAGSRDRFMRVLRRVHRERKREIPSLTPVRFFKGFAPAFHHCWLDTVALRPLPAMRTAEGDALVFARALFEVRDRTAVVAALDRHADLEPEDGAYAWLEDARDFRRVLGRFVLERNRLVVETYSEKRVQRGREFLEALVGDAVRFRVVEYEDPGRAIERLPAQPPDTAARVPPEIEARVIGDFYEEHYRRWLDEPIPALGNRSPREAARLGRVRSRLVALLQDFENMADRQRLEGRPAYDFGWMWAEPGLERPG